MPIPSWLGYPALAYPVNSGTTLWLEKGATLKYLGGFQIKLTIDSIPKLLQRRFTPVCPGSVRKSLLICEIVCACAEISFGIY